MFGIKAVQQYFSGQKTWIYDYPPATVLTGCECLKDINSPYSSYCLYICESLEQLTNIPNNTDLHLILFVAELQETILTSFAHNMSEQIHLLVVETKNPHDDSLKLQNYFHQKNLVGLFSAELLDMVCRNAALWDIVDYAHTVFQNTITIFDTDFRLLASSADEKKICETGLSVVSNHGLSIIKNQGFSQKEYDMINQSSFHLKAMKSDKPLLAPPTRLGAEQYICAINPEKNLGHIVLTAMERPFSGCEAELLCSLKHAVSELLLKNSFIQNSKGLPHEYFLRDLLDDNITSKQQYTDRLKYISCSFTGTLYCVVVQASRSSRVLNVHYIRRLFEETFINTKTLLYKNDIIVILDYAPPHDLISEDLKQISSFCEKYKMYTGISNKFTDIIHIKEYYEQAKNAIELGIQYKKSPSLFQYSDYYLNHLISVFSQSEQLETFCHPALKVLSEYDSENNSDLTLLMYTYLICERNVMATAAVMKMHRNSVQNRLKKIERLVSFDFNDHYDREYFILSYEFTHLSHK